MQNDESRMTRSTLVPSCAFLFCILHSSFCVSATGKPVPRLQAIPQPYDQVSFQRDGQEIARYHFGRDLRRPFVFPLVGPAGRSLTRMGHPRDPESHSHHNSVWISHHDVNGVSFWDDRAKGRIVHQRVEKLEDEGGGVAAVVTTSHWVDEAGGKVLLRERRRTEARVLEGGEWLLVIDLRLEPASGPVTLGKTPFGLLGVRMAKTVGVNDGGGEIRNSEGGVNEEQVLWKRAKWVDYSGPIAAGAVEGVTLMDHPSNPNHPTFFHVRNDGWMGASLTHDAPRVIEPGNPLLLRYGLYIHAGAPTPDQVTKRWDEFSKLPEAR
jgi:hypothetical protein